MKKDEIKTPKDLIPATMESLATLTRLPDKPPKLFGSDRKKCFENLRNAWQRKWLDLDCVGPQIQLLADKAEDYCGRLFRNNTHGSLFVIAGSFGSGKTHTAKAIFYFFRAAAWTAFERGFWGTSKIPDSVYIAWPEAVAAFSEHHFGLFEDALSNDLVILDDIGAENDPWKIGSDRLCQILSRRENKFTIVTTNIVPVKWAEKFDGRISDRLMRNSVIVDISTVPSYAMKHD